MAEKPMNTPFLTVAIPTFNRAADLVVAVASVLEQPDDPAAPVEILISDNASVDATPRFVAAWEQAHPGRLRAQRHETNIGFSRNVQSVIAAARAPYVLLLSDDDALEPGALARVREAWGRHPELGLLLLPEMPYDSELSQPRRPVAAAPTGEDLFTCGLDYIRHFRAFPPFLVSGYVVRRDAWLAAVRESDLDSMCVHVLTSMRLLRTHAACRLRQPLIRYRADREVRDYAARWREDDLYPFTFHFNLLASCRALRPEVPLDVFRLLRRQPMRAVIYHLLEQARVGGRFDQALFRRRLAALAERDDIHYWVARLLLLTPRPLRRLLFDAFQGRRAAGEGR